MASQELHSSMELVVRSHTLIKIETSKLVVLAYFHSVVSYGIIFRGNSADSRNIFCVKEKIVRVTAGLSRG
jgi:hypothetical protein